MNRKASTTLILIAQIVLILMFAAPALATETGGFSGFVFHDSNGDGTVQTDEPDIGGALVYIQKIDADTPQTVVADADGLFVVPDLTYGTYHVWAESPERNMVSARTIELEIGEVVGLGETNGDVIVSLPVVYDLSNDIQFLNVSNIFLPFVNR